MRGVVHGRRRKPRGAGRQARQQAGRRGGIKVRARRVPVFIWHPTQQRFSAGGMLIQNTAMAGNPGNPAGSGRVRRNGSGTAGGTYSRWQARRAAAAVSHPRGTQK